MKSILNGLTITLGLFLIFAGGAFLYSGFDIIDVERGWAKVIAGASLLAGGAIVLSLAFVLLRLDSLRNEWMQRAALAPTQPMHPLHEPQSTYAAHDPDHATPALEAVKPVVPMAAVAGGAGLAVATALAASGRDAHPEDAHADDVHPSVPDEPGESLSLVDPPHVPETSADHSLDRTPSEVKEEMAEPATGREDAPYPQVLGAKAQEAPINRPDFDLDDRWLDDALSGLSGAPAATPDPAFSVAPIAAHSEVTIVARYQAGGIDYVMYSDGSIDADDKIQVRHFASMEHLKDHMAGHPTA